MYKKKGVILVYLNVQKLGRMK